VIVGIVIAAVLILLVVIMLWANKRDRAKGHINRGMGDIRGTIRQERLNMQALRRGGGRAGVPSPHELARRNARRPGERR
jgi:FtsZ-interacting cell division protein ZipA